MHPHKRKIGILTVALVVVLTLAGVARADVVYTSLGPLDSYYTGSGHWATDNQSQGVKFTVVGADYSLDTVELPISYTSAGTRLVVELAADAGSVPGTVLEQMSLVEEASSETAVPHIATVASVSRTVLQQGTAYWVVLRGEPGYEATWHENTLGIGGTAFRNDTYPNWTTNPLPSSAFRVRGTPTPGTLNQPPRLLLVPGAATINELAPYTFTAFAWDPEEKPLTFSLVGAPAGASIDPVTGAFSWTPTEEQGPGNYPFKVSVFDDGELSADAPIILTVEEVNQPPVWVPPGELTVNEGEKLDYTLVFTDADLPAQGITFSGSSLPAGADLYVDGRFIWTPAESQGPGDYQIAFWVSDGYGSQTMSFTVHVNEANQPPVLGNPGTVSVDPGGELVVPLWGRDYDEPPQALEYRLQQYPEGMSIDAQFGVIRWTPTEAYPPGDYPVTACLTDTYNAMACQTFVVHINQPNRPPVLSVPTQLEATVGSPLMFSATATDPDPGDYLTFSLGADAPAGVNINPWSGAIFWMPAEEGTFSLTVSVTDGELSDTETVSVTVLPQAGTIIPTDLGPLPGYANSSAVSVNAAGEAVGYSYEYEGEGMDRATLWLAAPAHGLPAGTHDLGVLEGCQGSAAVDINAKGQVVGNCVFDGYMTKAFLWLPQPAYDLTAGMHPIPGLLGPDGSEPVLSMVVAINDAGQVVGNFVTSVWIGDQETGYPEYQTQGFLWQNGDTTLLTMGPDDATPITIPWGNRKPLNEYGHVLAVMEDGPSLPEEGPIYRAVLWQNGAATILTPEGKTSEPVAINAKGEVVGRYGESKDVFLWLPLSAYGLDAGCHLLADEAERFVSNEIRVHDINDSGRIVGHSTQGFQWIVDENGYPVYDENGEPMSIEYPGALWIWEDGAFQDIATMNGKVEQCRVNASGQVAGCSSETLWEWNYPIYQGFFWTDADGLQALQTLGGAEIGVYDLNDAGQMVGNSSLAGETSLHACIWGEPPPANQTPIADAGPDQSTTVAHDGDPATNTVSVTMDGSASSDPDGDMLTFSWAENGMQITTGVQPSVTLTPGVHTITLTVTDPSNGVDTDDVVVTVEPEPNQAPTADPGADQSVTAANGTSTVTLNGSGSSDPDGDLLTYTWTEGGVDIATGASPSVSLAVGTHIITLTITDPYGDVGADDVTVVVSETPPASVLTISNVTVSRVAGRKGKPDVITVKGTVANPSSSMAANALLTAATLGGADTTTRLPRFGNIKPGGAKTFSLQFMDITPGETTLSIKGTCSLGDFFTDQEVVVP